MFPQANLLAWCGKNPTQQKHAFTNQNVLQHEIHKKPKPGLVSFYDIRPGNVVGLISKENISKEGDK